MKESHCVLCGTTSEKHGDHTVILISRVGTSCPPKLVYERMEANQ